LSPSARRRWGKERPARHLTWWHTFEVCHTPIQDMHLGHPKARHCMSPFATESNTDLTICCTAS
jgi:hypothetical protein